MSYHMQRNYLAEDVSRVTFSKNRKEKRKRKRKEHKHPRIQSCQEYSVNTMCATFWILPPPSFELYCKR